MKVLLTAIVFSGLVIAPAAAESQKQDGGAKQYAPGQLQTKPGEAKKFAPGQRQKKPGQAKKYAPGQRAH
jgi:hypothetical protein